MKLGNNSMDADALLSAIERVERLQAEKALLQDDIKGIFQDAKASGFEPKIMRRIIKIRANPAQASQEDALVDVYCKALGM